MDRFQEAIEEEAHKLIARHERYAQGLADEFHRRRRRSTSTTLSKQVKRPSYWSVADGFNPYLARARAARIAHSIRKSISNHSYRPRNPIRYDVPKDDGTTRPVSVFQVADSAISRLLYHSLIKRNRAKLSARSYAFRGDLTIHDAIQYLHTELEGEARVFIAEFDFSNYFASIAHDHIRRVLRDEKFLITPEEHRAVNAFLAVTPADAQNYTPFGSGVAALGVPLGTALSLFLANVAAWPLDRRLERLGIGYVRYADDTFMWSKSYGKLTAAVDVLNEELKNIGSTLNFSKSPGISLFTNSKAQSEIRSKSRFTFIGHEFVRLESAEHGLAVGMSKRKLTGVRERVDRLIYYNLLHEPLAGTQDMARLGSVDRDYVVLVWQLRRFIYGRLSERQVQRALNAGVHGIRLSGLLSYYPLVDAFDSLSALDGWLAAQVWLAMRKRARLLAALGAPSPLPPPHGLSREDTLAFMYKSRSTGGILDLRLPSAHRMARLVRMAASIHGPNTVGRIDMSHY